MRKTGEKEDVWDIKKHLGGKWSQKRNWKLSGWRRLESWRTGDPDKQMTDVWFSAVGARSMETSVPTQTHHPHSAAWGSLPFTKLPQFLTMASEVGQRRTHFTDGNMRDRRRGLTESLRFTKPLGDESHTGRLSHTTWLPGLSRFPESRVYDRKVSEWWLRIESVSLEKEEARGGNT